MVKEKRCNLCGEIKPASEFWKNSSRKNGLQSRCKICMDLYRKTDVEKAKRSARAMRWNKLNPEKTKAHYVAWVQKPESQEYLKEYHHQYHIEHQEKKANYCREWRKNNHERNQRGISEWNETHPERASEYAKTRTERLKNAPGSVTDEEIIELLERYGHRCLCCGRHESELGKPLQIDHIVPVTSGGSKSIDNLQPLCKSCNAKKHTKTIDYRPLFTTTYRELK